MAGIWSTTLNLDLTIPTNGNLTPGSGTVYIGGPNLPTTLPPNYKSALIFYTDPAGLAQGIDYWYIAHYSDGGADALQIGYYPTGGPVVLSVINELFLGNRHLVGLDSQKGDIYLRVLSPDGSGNGQVYIHNNADAGVIQLATKSGSSQFQTFGRSELIELDTRGAPIIKAWNSPTIDQWQSNGSFQTLNTIGGCTVKFDWRITVDRICDTRVTVNIPGAGLPAIPTNSFMNLPAAFPITNAAITNPFGPMLAGMWNVGSTGAQGPVNARIDSAGAKLNWFGTPAGVNDMIFSGSFSLDK